MSIPAWKAQALEVFRGERGLEKLPAILAKTRAINVPPHEVFRSVAFDWMETIHRHSRSIPEHLPASTLQGLLDAGLDPHGGRPSFGHISDSSARQKAMMRHLQAVREGPRNSEASFRYSLAAPFRKDLERQHETNWLGKVIWCARDHPRLVSMVGVLLDAGVHPHDQGDHRFEFGPEPGLGFAGEHEMAGEDQVRQRLSSPWSAWPTALCSGRVDVLERLAQTAGDVPPPDWASAVLVALKHGSRAPTRWAQVRGALAWFTHRYPPTPMDCKAVMSRLWRDGRVDDDDALAVWLSLPCAQLAHPRKPAGAPDSFNPWACLGFPDEDAVPFHDLVLNALADHPRWGCAQAVLSCPAQSRSRYPSQAPGASVVAAWLTEGGVGQADATTGFRHRLFGALDGLPGLSDPAISESLACQKNPPDKPASAWLRRNPDAWLSPSLSVRTPWHFGPTVRVQKWLESMGVSPWTVDDKGVSGLAQGVASLIQKRDAPPLVEIGKWLASSLVNWEEKVGSRTLEQWVRGSSVLAEHAPGAKKRFDLASLQVALESCDHHGIASLLKHRGSAGLSGFDEQQSQALVESWMPPRPSGDWKEVRLGKEELDLREKIWSRLCGHLSPGLSKTDFPKKGLWLHRAWRPAVFRSSHRRDMVGIWELYDQHATWSKLDMKALVDWAGQDITLSVVYGSPSSGPWTSPRWSEVSMETKAALARAVLTVAALSKNAFGLHADLNAGWMEVFMKGFSDVSDIHAGSSPRRLEKTQALLAGPVLSEVGPQSADMARVINSWVSAGRFRHLQQSLQPSPPITTPRQRF